METANNLFNDFFPSGPKSREKNFVTFPAWRAEIDEWLKFIREKDPTYYERSKSRVRQDAWKQEEVMAELRSIYYFGKIEGFHITALEPERVDFSFIDSVGEKWNAEVKCPSYLKEIFERDISMEEKLVRKQQPKYINESSQAFYPSGYDDAIEHSVGKFKKVENNLLIISDNKMIELIGDPLFEEHLDIALRNGDMESKISAVLLLTVRCDLDNNFNFRNRFRMISKSPHLKNN